MNPDFSLHRMLDAAAVQAAYREGVRSFRAVTITGHFTGLDLEGVDFSGAHLRQVTFEGIRLSQVNFEGATLSGVTFRDATLAEVALSRVICHGAVFVRSVITESDFNEVSAKQKDLQFHQVALATVNFRHAQLQGIDFAHCRQLQGLDFTQAQLIRVTFRAAKLRQCIFLEAAIAGTDFREATVTESTFERARLGTVPSQLKAALFALPAIALAAPLMLVTYIFFWSGWNATFLNVMLGCLGIVVAAIPLWLALMRQETSFRHATLDGLTFSGAKLASTNFCGASCRSSNFQWVETGVDAKALRQFTFIYTSLLLTILAILLTAYLGASFWEILRTLSTTNIGPSHSRFLACIAIVVLGFVYFLVVSLCRSLNQAVVSLPLIAIAIGVINFNQPILTAIVWGLALFVLGRMFQILFAINLWLTVGVGAGLVTTAIATLFQYDSIVDENLITLQAIPIILMVTVFTALRTASAITEIGFFTHWPFTWVVAPSIVLTAPIGLFYFGRVGQALIPSSWTGGGPADLKMVIFPLLLGMAIWGGILLGIYFGWQTLRDRAEYRLVRDRSIFLCHWLGQFGTKFKGANLAHANFAFANLSNSDFLHASLDYVCWYGATRLASDRVGRSYLRFPAVRQLVTRRGGLSIQRAVQARRLVRRLYRLPRRFQRFLKAVVTLPTASNFAHLDLQKIRLSHWAIAHEHGHPISPAVNLSGLSFAGANLRGADLRGANLTGTNLIGAQLSQADLRDTALTNACIRNWHIDDTTNFTGATCTQVLLDDVESSVPQPIPIPLGDQQGHLHSHVFETLLLQDEDFVDLSQLKEEFTKIDSIPNKIHREYKLSQLANLAHQRYGVDGDRYRQMFEYYLRSKRQSGRQKSWWQSILWFKIEPKVERFNQLTQELDIFPLLENLGRLSILVAVITFVNNTLKPADINIEQYYRSWEIIHSDTEQVRGARRFALEQLRTGDGSLIGVKASGQDLQGINLRGANLTSADLSDSELDDALLSGAVLTNANLQKTRLRRAQLGTARQGQATTRNIPKPPFLQQSADLTQANLVETDLTAADLSGVNLTKADLTNANLRGSNLTRANLNEANLTDANLRDADLTRADLLRANLRQANLSNADLDGADLRRTDLRGANLVTNQVEQLDLTHAIYDADTKVAPAIDLRSTGAYLIDRGADLTNADLTAQNLSGVNLAHAKFAGALLGQVNFNNAELRYTSFQSDTSKPAVLRAASFNRADLRWTDLKNTDLQQADFSRADLRFANLAGAKGNGIKLQGTNLQAANLSQFQGNEGDLSKANLRRARLENTSFIKASFVGAQLMEANLTGADLTGADLTNANLTGAVTTDLTEAAVIYCNTIMPDGTVNQSGC